MPEQQITTYEAPAVEDLSVEEGPATVQAGAKQQPSLTF
jgi:hypothetical protein